jgi:tRNA (guanosine-2'-O-)-methyltransferase
LLETLKSQGTLIISLEGTDASEDIFHFLDHENIDSRDVCLILGSEREGVDPRMLALSDSILHIPMRGMKQSLNVSIAGALGMYLLFAKKKNIV